MDKKIRVQIIYKDKIYEHQDGLSAYLFDFAVKNDLDSRYGEKVIKRYIETVKCCCRYDCHETPIADFANYVANYWDCVCDFENYSEVLDRFYENRTENS